MKANFYFQRPPAHYASNGIDLAPNASGYPKQKELGNLDKFVIDSLAGIMYAIPMVTKIESVKAYIADPGYTELEFSEYA